MQRAERWRRAVRARPGGGPRPAGRPPRAPGAHRPLARRDAGSGPGRRRRRRAAVAHRRGARWPDVVRRRTSTCCATSPAPDDRLVLVQGRPVLVDTARSVVQTLDASGRPAVESCLDVRDDDVRLLGSSTGAELYAAQSATGSFVTAAVGHDDCERVVALAEPGAADFGELVQSGPFVFVPDRASGRANVVDTRDGQVTPLDLVDPGHDVELVAEGGFVFYNDRDGERAGVLSARRRAVERVRRAAEVRPGDGGAAARADAVRAAARRRRAAPSSRRRTPPSPRRRPRRPLLARGRSPARRGRQAERCEPRPRRPRQRRRRPGAADGRADHGDARRPDARRAGDVHRDGGPGRRRDVGVVDRRRVRAPPSPPARTRGRSRRRCRPTRASRSS